MRRMAASSPCACQPLKRLASHLGRGCPLRVASSVTGKLFIPLDKTEVLLGGGWDMVQHRVRPTSAASDLELSLAQLLISALP